ncbi:class I SAM-dependent methyltransferase [Streptomyces sp. HNM0575]|uniref:class I SAM-dependent methyltransferase n=1 Tax=Streptomyces sp. HNM0575 TaxID=2716338 RepID=UPI00145D1CBF|nr:class I SAM-dependent methyltransferase [Streptomyces sp. HNM0575]NLU72943.1 class I SAM-dependent methyltransferase [Streptomyces sp. HNM0575]
MGAVGRDLTWDEWYAERDRIWSGRPNDVLVRETEGLRPGRALDLGCGEGADAVWLAGQGWRVTAADISCVALDRAAEHAVEAGVVDRIDWQRHDLGVSFPEGAFDLVSAQFLHSYGDLPREEILRRAADAVAPGGTLLIEGHSGPAPWDDDQGHGQGQDGDDRHGQNGDHGHGHGHSNGHASGHDELHLPSPDEVVAALRLPEGEWEVLLSEEHRRTQTGPDGTPAIRTDNTVKLRRRAL